MIELAKDSIILLAALIFVGGLTGYFKGKSKASLIAGTVSSALLGAAFKMCSSHPKRGFAAADILLLLLDVIFALRLKKTGKFMPSGLLLVLCVLEQIFLTYVIVQ